MKLARRFWAWPWVAFASWWALWILMQTFAAWRSDIHWPWIITIDACWLVGVPLSILDGRMRRRHEDAATDAA